MYPTVYILILTSFLNSLIGASMLTDIKPPPDCTEGFCTTKPEGYDQLEALINEAAKDLNLKITVADRSGAEDVDYGGDDINCRYFRRVMRPFMKVGRKDNIIIAQTEILQQEVEEIKCLDTTGYGDTKKECFFYDKRTEISTQCKETTTEISIYTLNMLEHSLVSRNITVSVWCSCHTAFNFQN